MLVFEDTLAKRPLFCVYYISKMNYPWVDLGNTKVQHLSFEYFTSRGVTLAGAKAANRV